MNALVVGASAGIGRATARRLHQLGYSLAIVGRRKDRLHELAAEVGGAEVIVADLVELDSCRTVVERAVDALGPLDLIVHAAGASGLAPLGSASAADWSSVLHTNVVAPALVAAAAIDHLTPPAVVCFLSSEAVGNPHHGLVPYAASKAALEEVVRGFRVEHPEARFCCLRVGATEGTDFARDFSPELGLELLPKWIASGQIPAQLMDAVELGSAVADAMDLAVRSPGLDLQDVVIRAPGRTHTGDTDVLADKFNEVVRRNE